LNFAGSLTQGGELWFCFRYAWIGIGVLWTTLNLFYWPFWLSQDNQRLVNTYRNGFVMLLRTPVTVLALSAICAVFILVSCVTLFPLALALMAWLSLVGILTVRWAIDEDRQQQGGHSHNPEGTKSGE